MGYLIEKTKLSILVNGNGVAENFKENSIELYEMYSKSSKEVQNIPIKNILPGAFYHLQMIDKSNWMRNAPVFIVDFKKFSNKIILLGINLNFVPLEVRAMFFDKFISEDAFEKNEFIKTTYPGVYNELKSIGFEYSLMEFDASKITFAHKISMSKLPQFLISQHPTNVYDARKLFEIWKAKIGKQEKRDEEIKKSNLEDFYNIQKDLTGKYDALKKHIMRIRNNL